jgi:hypothetical protein
MHGDEFQRGQEAGGIASSKQLLRIGAFAARAAEFLWRGELDVQLVVACDGTAFAAASGGCLCLVQDLHGVLFRWDCSVAME